MYRARSTHLRTLIVASLSALATAMATQGNASQSDLSAHTFRPRASLIPTTRDIPYHGVITLDVDATNVAQHILSVHEQLPVRGYNSLVLLYPQWIPGSHAPSGHLEQLAGITIRVDGSPAPWRRDSLSMFAFHVHLPATARVMDVSYQILTAGVGSAPRVMTQKVLDLDWTSVLLYPAGYYARRILYRPSVKLPAGWSYATALDGAQRLADTITFAPVDMDTLGDSPVLAGLYMHSYALTRTSPSVHLDIAADKEEDLALTRQQLAAFTVTVKQTSVLFGSAPFNHYDFLVWLSDEMSGKDREHLRSSEIGSKGDYFANGSGPLLPSTIPHEFSHSWNGKFRRPADLWTPNYNTPEENSLLGVYEGQTEYWGDVLAARAGMRTPQDSLDVLAAVAADMELRVGRSWRDLADTQDDPIISYTISSEWDAWQRQADYYFEGEFLWLDVDTLIRERSGGRRSLDDFARSFFGQNSTSEKTETYTFEQLVAAPHQVEPYDWASFLNDKLYGHSSNTTLESLNRAGYELTYTESPSDYADAMEAAGTVDLSTSIGLTVGQHGVIRQVQWESPAFRAGLAPGERIATVGAIPYSIDALKSAVKEARTRGKVDLLLQGNEQPVHIWYHDGLRYPHLKRIPGTPDRLSQILRPRE